MSEEPQKTFEQALERLEEIVALMEKGELTLDDSLSLFQEGVTLSQHCTRRLNDAEAGIQKLVRIEDGKFILEPFSSSDPNSSQDT
jgi:exodeoxyribonuclease VII small subunit